VQLGRAILGYTAVMTAVITLAPFRFASAPVHGLSGEWTLSDIVLNIVMFVPLGFLYELTHPPSAGEGRGSSLPRAFVLGALLSAAIEIAQLFEADRFTSLFDIVTNATGALVGSLLHGIVARRVRAANAVRSLALELPLMGLLYLLAPLMWLAGLAGGDDLRRWLILPIAAVAGGVLGTVHAAYVAPALHPPILNVTARQRSVRWLIGATVAWYLVAVLPSGVRDANLLVAGATLAVGVSVLRSIATTRYREAAPATAQGRRFELPTLRLLLPLFAAYLALSSLWPLDGAGPTWHAGVALLPPSIEPSKANVLIALEHIAAFTLVGYIIAEFHGRDVSEYRRMLPRVLTWSGGISLLLEATRGWHPAYGASAAMLVLTCGAGVFGGWLYQLQREHVRALVVRGR
jgi:glycopeptide antibiotics resistance protein